MPIILELLLLMLLLILLLLSAILIQMKYWPNEYISVSILNQLVIIRHDALYSEPIASIESDRCFIDCLYMQVD